MEIERYLAAAMEEENQMRRYQVDQMKLSWEENKRLKQQMQEEEKKNTIDFDHANCGASSALKFSGEDTNRTQRIQQQKDQMRRWIQEQIAEKRKCQPILP